MKAIFSVIISFIIVTLLNVSVFGQVTTQDFLVLGNKFYKDKLYSKALIYYKQAIKPRKDFFEGYFNLGNTYNKLNSRAFRLVRQ